MNEQPQQNIPNSPKKRFKFFNLFKPGRIISCGCITIFLILGLIIALFLLKPAGIWGSTVDFLNEGVKLPEAKYEDYSAIVQQINTQVKNNGDNTIEISTSQLNTLAKEKLTSFRSPQFIIEENKLYFYWILDNSSNENPLYGYVEMSSDKQSLKIDKIGTKRITLPGFINSFADSTVKSLLSGDPDSSTDLITKLIPTKRNFSVKNIEFKQGKVLLTIVVNFNLL